CEAARDARGFGIQGFGDSGIQGFMHRRQFLEQAAAAALIWPTTVERLRARVQALNPQIPESPNPSVAQQDFWNKLRSEFLIPGDRIYLNIGTLGPQPKVVLDAACEHMRRVAMTYPPG